MIDNIEKRDMIIFKTKKISLKEKEKIIRKFGKMKKRLGFFEFEK